MRECSICGAEFEPVSIRNVVCSDACRQKRKNDYLRQWRRKPVAPPAPRPCAVCGQEFQPRKRQHLVCSTVCRQKNHRKYFREWKESRREIRSCEVCGVQLPKSRVKYCDQICQKLGQVRKAAERKRAREAAFMREFDLRERLLQRATKSRQMPRETAFADEIEAYLKKGRKITQIPSVWAEGSIYEGHPLYEEPEN